MEELHLTSSETCDYEQVIKEYEFKASKKDKRVRKSYIQWSSEETYNLIGNVKKFENLWNTSHRSYKDREIHRYSWEKIAQALNVPKQEVIVKWNSLRSNYRIHLKNQRYSKNDQTNNNRKPNPFFVAMNFLGPILKFDDGKQSESSSAKILNSKKSSSGSSRIRSSHAFNDLDNIVLDIIKKGSSRQPAIKDETSLLSFEENLPSVSQEDDNSYQEEDNTYQEKDNSHQESRIPILSPVNKKRHMQLNDEDDEEKEQEKYEEALKKEDEIHALKKRKMQLEIYNLQLDALKKETDLGLQRSAFTAELYKNFEVPIKEETSIVC